MNVVDSVMTRILFLDVSAEIGETIGSPLKLVIAYVDRFSEYS